jgi:hypothetical protein
VFSYNRNQKRVYYEQINKKRQIIDNSVDLFNLYQELSSHKCPTANELIKSKQWPNYLLSPILHNISVLDTRKLNKDQFFKFDNLNLFIGFPDNNQIRMNFLDSDVQILYDLIPDKSFYVNEYHLLLSNIRDINSERLDSLFVNIYNNNKGILNNPKLTDEKKEKSWILALSNITKSNPQSLSEHDNKIFHIWLNIMNSPFCFYILMYGLPPSAYFNIAFEKLLIEPTTFKLLLTCLYPISFLFAPFICSSGSINKVQNQNGKKLVYKQNITQYFNDIVKNDDAEKCGWIGLMFENGENKNLCLLNEY